MAAHQRPWRPNGSHSSPKSIPKLIALLSGPPLLPAELTPTRPLGPRGAGSGLSWPAHSARSPAIGAHFWPLCSTSGRNLATLRAGFLLLSSGARVWRFLESREVDLWANLAPWQNNKLIMIHFDQFSRRVEKKAHFLHIFYPLSAHFLHYYSLLKDMLSRRVHSPLKETLSRYLV